jgi:endonuclease/exonuclease/phosphatase family metal-dependent hydrolase
MAWYGGTVRRAVTAVLTACLIGVAALVPAERVEPASVVLLQMNLCNSGRASCFTAGRAVEEAAAMVHRQAADVVTLQEICRDDVLVAANPGGLGTVARALADLHPDDRVSVHFVAAGDPDTGSGFRCNNGELFGNAVLHHGDGLDSYGGWFADWDIGDEIRSWGCAEVVLGGRLTVCTTHISDHARVTVAQCRELFAILAREPWARTNLVLAGDLNLPASRLGECGTDGFRVASDDSVQHVLVRNGLRPVRGRVEPMRWTDHPALVQVVAL